MLAKKIIGIQVLKFALSGGLATVCHWLVMAIMIYAGASALTATSVGALFGAIVNYYLQRNFTFQSTSSHCAVLMPYVFVCIQTWVTNFVLFYILHHISELNTVYAQIITTLITALLSYFLYKRIVFNDR